MSGHTTTPKPAEEEPAKEEPQPAKEEVAEQPSSDVTERPKLQGIKVVGKIDLDANAKGKKPEEAPQEEKPAPSKEEPKPETVAEQE